MLIEFKISGESPELGVFKKGETRRVPVNLGETYVMRGMARVSGDEAPKKKKKKEEVKGDGGE